MVCANFAARIDVQLRPIIRLIEENYEIPQLGVSRKISALLPADYENSGKTYPVLYLQDGQNLFNPNAPYGDWAIDKSLAQLAGQGMQDLVVIAIDHGEEERIYEYSPYYNPLFGEGKGQQYVSFLTDTLVPYINSHFRVSSRRHDTGIGGSSMGGLISLYAGLTAPANFGKLMVFSPSLWISPMIYHHADQCTLMDGDALYLYAGGMESKSHIPNIKRLDSIMSPKFENLNFARYKCSIYEKGQHGEYYWAHEFPKAIKWLYFNE